MKKGSVYMRWAKEHAEARYNLANSGILGCSTEDLTLEPGDLQINGPNHDGYVPLRKAIAAEYGVSSKEVVLAQGTSGANFLAFATLVNPGDTVLVEQPTYEPILAALEFLGARVQRFKRRFENGYRVDLDELKRMLSVQIRLVVLTNPHNPSGVLLPEEDVKEAGRLAEQVGAYFLVDEVYRDVWFGAAPASPLYFGPNFLTTSSLTKAYGLGGLRCGWVLGDVDLVVEKMLRVKDCMESVNSMPSEALALAAFRQLPRLTERSRSILEPNLAQVHAFLADHAEWLDCVVPERSTIVFPRLKKEEDSEPLHDWLRTRETSIVPGKFFESLRHFRLGFAVEPENVAEGLRHLSEGLRRLG